MLLGEAEEGVGEGGAHNLTKTNQPKMLQNSSFFQNRFLVLGNKWTVKVQLQWRIYNVKTTTRIWNVLQGVAFASCLQGIKIPVGVVGGGIIPTASLSPSGWGSESNFNVLLVYCRVCVENSQFDKALQPQKPFKSKVSLSQRNWILHIRFKKVKADY